MIINDDNINEYMYKQTNKVNEQTKKKNKTENVWTIVYLSNEILRTRNFFNWLKVEFAY